MCCFIAQLVEHRTGIAEVTGSNPVEALDCEQSLSFPSVFLAFLRASVELISIIFTEFCARRISGTKTDYS